MEALIIGCGPGGEKWRETVEEVKPDLIIAINTAIKDTADIADIFLCVENLHGKPWRWFPWITTETRARKIINSKTVAFMGSHPAALGMEPFNRPATPTIYPKSSVGTVLYHALRILDEWPEFQAVDKVHLVGFPLSFVDGIQHWTEEDRPYTKDATYWMKTGVFVQVNGVETLWQFAMAAAFVKIQRWNFEVVNHSGGLLDIPGIGKLWEHHKRKPNAELYTIGEGRLKVKPRPPSRFKHDCGLPPKKDEPGE